VLPLFGSSSAREQRQEGCSAAALGDWDWQIGSCVLREDERRTTSTDMLGSNGCEGKKAQYLLGKQVVVTGDPYSAMQPCTAPYSNLVHHQSIADGSSQVRWREAPSPIRTRPGTPAPTAV